MYICLRRIYFYLFILLCVSGTILFLFLNTLSISYSESLRFFGLNLGAGFFDFARVFSTLSVKIFGQNDFTLRLPFLILHLCNTLLMFYFALLFLKKEKDALFCALLFCLLPGVNAAALLVSNIGIVIFLTLLLCIIEQKTQRIFYPLLFLMALVDKSFALVFLALIFYGISKKNTFLIFIALFLFALNMYLYGLGIGGYPRGYFIDSNGHLLLIFSPLLFLYFLYTLYRYCNAKTKPLVWYIAIISLTFIWIISLRQKVQTEVFAPLLLVALPLMVSLYFSGLRVRLPQFRTRYKIPFFATFIVLIFTSGILFLSKPLFLLLPNFENHFAKNHFLAKELAIALKQKNITSIKTNKKMQLRLKFYGITQGNRILSTKKSNTAQKIPIIFYHKNIATFYLQ